MVQIPSISHFKGLDMRNLQYEIRTCQKGHNKVKKTVLSLLRFFMRQTLIRIATAVVIMQEKLTLMTDVHVTNSYLITTGSVYC